MFADLLLATDGKKDPRYKALMNALFKEMEDGIAEHKEKKAVLELATEQRKSATDFADAKLDSVTAACNKMAFANAVVSGALASLTTSLNERAKCKAKEEYGCCCCCCSPPMLPDAYVKVEVVVKEEAGSGGRPKRLRKA